MTAQLIAVLGVYIDNTSPRFDTLDRLMDIHDGSLSQWEADGKYYWYGLGYGNCTLSRIYMPPQYCSGVFLPFGSGCGFNVDHALHVYSSRDLVRWTYEGDVLPMNMRPKGIYFRPKVIFDARTSEYVLWINYLRRQGASWPANTPLQSYISNISTLVAKSTSPTGPFLLATPPTVMTNLQVGGVGDFALIVGPEGSDAYIAYDAWDNGHRVRVERLNDDWTASLSGPEHTTGDLSDADVEAPILFERNGWYYLLYGSTCCFCAEGGRPSRRPAPARPMEPAGHRSEWLEPIDQLRQALTHAEQLRERSPSGRRQRRVHVHGRSVDERARRPQVARPAVLGAAPLRRHRESACSRALCLARRLRD